MASTYTLMTVVDDHALDALRLAYRTWVQNLPDILEMDLLVGYDPQEVRPKDNRFRDIVRIWQDFARRTGVRRDLSLRVAPWSSDRPLDALIHLPAAIDTEHWLYLNPQMVTRKKLSLADLQPPNDSYVLSVEEDHQHQAYNRFIAAGRTDVYQQMLADLGEQPAEQMTFGAFLYQAYADHRSDGKIHSQLETAQLGLEINQTIDQLQNSVRQIVTLR